jgi:hypothetical protein
MKVTSPSGLYEDGQPGELFIQMSKEGSTIGGLMDTVATLTSMALQYGVPLESLVKKFAYQRFEPSGFTKNPRYPQRQQHYRLRLPLARLPVHQGLQGSDLAQPLASRAAAERNRRHGKKGRQSAGLRPFAHGRQGPDRRHHESRA